MKAALLLAALSTSLLLAPATAGAQVKFRRVIDKDVVEKDLKKVKLYLSRACVSRWPDLRACQELAKHKLLDEWMPHTYAPWKSYRPDRGPVFCPKRFTRKTDEKFCTHPTTLSDHKAKIEQTEKRTRKGTLVTLVATTEVGGRFERRTLYDRKNRVIQIKDTVFCAGTDKAPPWECFRGTWDYRSGKVVRTGMLRATRMHEVSVPP